MINQNYLAFLNKILLLKYIKSIKIRKIKYFLSVINKMKTLILNEFYENY